MKEKVTLDRKEQKRLKVLNEVIVGHMTGQLAAEMRCEKLLISELLLE